MSTSLDSYATRHAVPEVLVHRPGSPAIVLQLVGHLARTAMLWVALWVLVHSGAALSAPLALWPSLTVMLAIGYASFIAKCWLSTRANNTALTTLVLCTEILCMAQCIEWLN